MFNRGAGHVATSDRSIPFWVDHGLQPSDQGGSERLRSVDTVSISDLL
jgi:hypothetical protein